ncbi:MAG: hypothetical protein Q9220_007048 [cf. Caloplaca sp. 1 TL-2023]
MKGTLKEPLRRSPRNTPTDKAADKQYTKSKEAEFEESTASDTNTEAPIRGKRKRRLGNSSTSPNAPYSPDAPKRQSGRPRQISHASPAKRGRPPKHDSSTPGGQTFSPQQTPKRKPGRPRKGLHLGQAVDEAVNEKPRADILVSPQQTPKRKPGRPRKGLHLGPAVNEAVNEKPRADILVAVSLPGEDFAAINEAEPVTSKLEEPHKGSDWSMALLPSMTSPCGDAPREQRAVSAPANLVPSAGVGTSKQGTDVGRATLTAASVRATRLTLLSRQVERPAQLDGLQPTEDQSIPT